MKCDGPVIAKVEKALMDIGGPREVLPAVLYILLCNCDTPAKYEEMKQIMHRIWIEMQIRKQNDASD